MRAAYVVLVFCLCVVAGCQIPLASDVCSRAPMLAAAQADAADLSNINASSSEYPTSNENIPTIHMVFSTELLTTAAHGSVAKGFAAQAHVTEGIGYRILVINVMVGHPPISTVDLDAYTREELQERATEPFSAHGVHVSPPERISKGQGGAYGGTVVYESHITTENPGDYTIVFALLRPFDVHDHPKFAVIRAEIK